MDVIFVKFSSQRDLSGSLVIVYRHMIVQPQASLQRKPLNHLTKICYTFFFVSSLVAKAPGRSLSEKLSNLLIKREALNN